MTADRDRVPLDAVALLEVLERHQVAYVVVGGYAAELHGSVRRTVDVDVVPRPTLDKPRAPRRSLARAASQDQD